jgi:hypothetical protein
MFCERPYLGWDEATYDPETGFKIPRLIQGALEDRAAEPFKLYSFLMEDEEHPYVAMFDDFARLNSDEFPSGIEPVVLRTDPERRVVLPEDFRRAAGIEDRVHVIGNLDRFEVWKPEHDEELRITDTQFLEKYGPLLDEIFEGYRVGAIIVVVYRTE